MRQRQQLYQSLIFLFILSLLIMLISPYPAMQYVSGVLESILVPIQKSVYSNVGKSLQKENEVIQSLKEKNLDLEKKLVQFESLRKDNKALRDQFATAQVISRQLLPVDIITVDTIIPGSLPKQMIISSGKNDGIRSGMAVVYKDILIGTISEVASHHAVVLLTTSDKLSLAAKTRTTGAFGILKGGQEMTFDQVILSESLKQGDVIITRGESNKTGLVYPPGLLLGKITVIDKKASALFQSARVQPLLDYTKLSTIFVIIK